jgi:SAM-dependent methyltransferase
MSGSFLENQARIGISVHLGGLPATRRLLASCHVARAGEVLDVGCGIGIGTVLIARTIDCRVIGVDRSPRMVDWARRRACDAGVGDRVSFVVADVLELPFEDGRFGATIAESVLTFVADKERAIAEMVRVTQPGGYVGLNEGFLLTEAPSPRVIALARRIGGAMLTLLAWRELWDRSGLDERIVTAYRLDAAREIRDRFRWVGLRRLFAASARATWQYVTEASTRQVLETMFTSLRRGPEDEPGAPPPWASFGYGLFVGRKPVDEDRDPALAAEPRTDVTSSRAT